VRLHRQATARLILLAALGTAFAIAWDRLNITPLLVLGQPTTVGPLQSEKEAPFFHTLAARTGLPLKVTYRSLDSMGLKDTHQLDALKEGRIDIASLRFLQNSKREPSLEGLDLPGMSLNFRTARQVADAYNPMLDRYLQHSFRTKLLGIWTFGAQDIFCRVPIHTIDDLRGKKIRVASDSLAQLIKAIGGIPAIVPFDDTKNALETGLVDCASTSAASANSAGWTQHTSHFFPLALNFGINGYVITLKKWNSLSPQQRNQLLKAFRDFEKRQWLFSEKLQEEARICTSGGPCRRLRPTRLTRVDPSEQDQKKLLALSWKTVVPRWAVRCERAHPGCAQEWRRKIAPLIYGGT
jgi:TRAP-type C4-dicarboxylate transport system substrate-binding protein